MKSLQVEEEAAIFYDDDHEVVITEQLDPEKVEATLKKPEEGSESDDDDESPDKNGPLRRKGGFRVSPGTSRKSSWYDKLLFPILSRLHLHYFLYINNSTMPSDN